MGGHTTKRRTRIQQLETGFLGEKKEETLYMGRGTISELWLEEVRGMAIETLVRGGRLGTS